MVSIISIENIYLIMHFKLFSNFFSSVSSTSGGRNYFYRDGLNLGLIRSLPPGGRNLPTLPLVPHICISESDQHWFRWWLVAYSAIIWTSAGLLSIGLVGTNFSEILIKNKTFSFKKMHLKMSSTQLVAILSRGRWVKWDDLVYHRPEEYRRYGQ